MFHADWLASTANIGHTWPMQRRVIDVEALLALRVARDMTMAELARRSGVSYSMIKYVHDGKFQFSDITAGRIADALGCRVEEFSRPKAGHSGVLLGKGGATS